MEMVPLGWGGGGKGRKSQQTPVTGDEPYVARVLASIAASWVARVPGGVICRRPSRRVRDGRSPRKTRVGPRAAVVLPLLTHEIIPCTIPVNTYNYAKPGNNM